MPKMQQSSQTNELNKGEIMAGKLDIDVGQLMKNLFSKKKSGLTGQGSGGQSGNVISMEYYKKTAVKSVFMLCATFFISMGINYFTKTSSNRLESEYSTIEEIDTAVAEIEQNISTSTVLLSKNRKKVAEIMPLFSDIGGSKTLFKLISNIAASTNMTINNLSQGDAKEQTTKSDYFRSKVTLDMQGYFQGYLNFKQMLSDQKPLLRLDSETIKLLLTKEGERKIQVTLDLTDYSIDKGEYENALIEKAINDK